MKTSLLLGPGQNIGEGLVGQTTAPAAAAGYEFTMNTHCLSLQQPILDSATLGTSGGLGV